MIMEKPGQQMVQLRKPWISLMPFTLTFLFLIITSGLPPSVLAAEPQPQYGGTFRIATTSARSYDPHMETWPQTTILTLNTYSGLLRTNKDMDGVELDLAESWKQVDAVTYVFKLRQGVRFHDLPPVNGRELTSEDVKYSIERISGLHGLASDFKHQYYFENQIESIQAPDKYTVIIKTKGTYAPFINYLASPFSPIVPKEAVEAFKDLKRNAIGSGPFILKEFIQGSHFSLVKNPKYFKKGLPYLDGIQCKFITEPSAMMAAYLAGQLDAMGATFYQVPTIKKEAPDSTIIERNLGFGLVLRCPPWQDNKPYQPPFDKLLVRQAIAMSIDKKKLLELAQGGYGKVQVGAVPNWPSYSLPASEQVEYNPEKAKKLLAEAGYPTGFTTELMTWNMEAMVKPAQIIQEMLGGVGIKVDLKIMEMAQYFNRMFKFDYQMALHMMGAGLDPEEWLVKYFGDPTESVTYKWQNKEVWRLISEQRKTIDKKKRPAIIQEIQRLLLKDAPNVWLYTQSQFNVNRPYVHRVLYENDYQPLVGELVWMEKH